MAGSTEALLGRELGNYVVRRLLGQGGMGAVFMAEHSLLGTRAALKVLHGAYATDESIAARFFQEAKAALSIRHPGVVRVLDFGRAADGTLYLVMELLEGRSLASALREERLDEGAVAQIGRDIADALAAAHALGIVHRDLKPDNIFLAEEGVKILDFGIAKMKAGLTGTQTGAIMGTPAYMAPEQARDSKEVGPHTDLYALGIVLFEMVTGRPPFLGQTMAELVTQHLFEAPPRPSTLGTISPQLEALILACLEKDPSQRPASALAVRDALTARLGASASSPSTPSAVPPASSPGTSMRIAHSTTLSGTASEALRQVPASRPRGRWITSAVVVAAAVGGALLLLNRGPTVPTEPPHRAAAAAPRPPERAPAPAATTSPLSRPEARRSTAELRLRLRPPEAKVILDGVVTEDNPLRLPRSDQLHRLEVSAPGYRPVQREFVATVDGVIDVVLDPSRQRQSHRSKPKDPRPEPTIGPVEDHL